MMNYLVESCMNIDVNVLFDMDIFHLFLVD